MPLCRSCRAPIEWAITEKGKRIPLDVAAAPSSDGNIVVSETPGPQANLAIVVPVGEGDRISHFATCPQANSHRGKR